jgi:hypothetical protein
MARPREIISEAGYDSEPVEWYEALISNTKNTAEKSDGLCDMCEVRAGERCPYCDRSWYCSPKCARKSLDHRFRCSGQAITTADYLQKAVLENEIPEDPETLEDYGFNRCGTWNEKSHLMGVYIGLMKYSVPEICSDEIDAWRRSGRLFENIIKTFNKMPEGCWGEYFPWLLLNKRTLTGGPEEKPTRYGNVFITAVEDAASLLSPKDPTKYISEIKPIEKRDLFFMFALARSSMRPHPATTYHLDLWYWFGFCTSSDEYEESRIGSLYTRLLGENKFTVDYNASLGISSSHVPNLLTASFEEFWMAYQSGKIVQLMRKYGLEHELQRCRYLDLFLSITPGEPHPRIWRLYHYLAFPTISLDIPPAAMKGAEHFGFSSGLNARMKIELPRFYKELLAQGHPLEMEQARNQNRLLSYAQEKLKEIDAGVVKILKKLL